MAAVVAIAVGGAGCRDRHRATGTLGLVEQPPPDASMLDAPSTAPSQDRASEPDLWQPPPERVETDGAALQLLAHVVDALARGTERDLDTLLGSPGQPDATGIRRLQVRNPAVASAIRFDVPTRMLRVELRGAIRGADLERTMGAFAPDPDAHREDEFTPYSRLMAGGRVEVTCYVPVTAPFAEAAVRQFDVRATRSP